MSKETEVVKELEVNESEEQVVEKEDMMNPVKLRESYDGVLNALDGLPIDGVLDVLATLVLRISELSVTNVKSIIRAIEDKTEEYTVSPNMIFRIIKEITDLNIVVSVNYDEDLIYVGENESHYDFYKGEWIVSSEDDFLDDGFIALLEKIIITHYKSDKSVHNMFKKQQEVETKNLSEDSKIESLDDAEEHA